MINFPARMLQLHSVFCALLVVAVGAHAEQSADQLEEITVTAQKVSESLQKTPIAVSVLSNDELKNLGITNAHDLDSYAPNVKVTESTAGLKFFIRGVGIDVFGVGNDSGVAFHRDGVYNPDTRSQIASFFDIDRIEVLRGPQGTLYGRNATGGVVNVITAQPTDQLTGYADLTYGNYNQADFEGAISGPIVQDTVNGRLAAMIRTHDGFGTNIGTGDKIDNQNEKAVRGTLAVKFTPDIDLHLSGQYFLKDDRSGGFHFFAVANPAVPLTGLTLGGLLNTNIRDVASEIDPRRYLETYDGDATLNWKLNDQWTVKSISGYGRTNSYLASDLDLTTAKSAQFFQTVKSEVYSEELQSVWTGAESRAIFGAYYFHETLLQAQPSPLFPPYWPPGGFQVTFDGTGSTRALALYADGQTAVNEKLTLSAGARYSSERRDTDSSFIFGFTPTPDVDARTWSAFTPKVAAQYQFTPDLMAYANISRGFKSGSFDIGNITPPVNPEFVWAYEVGVKSDALNNRLQANVAAFYYHYTDLQVAEVVATGIETANAANSRIFGTELELRALPWTGATVQINGGWLDAKYVKFNTIDPVNPQLGVISLAGNTLSTAPRFNASLAGDQSLPLDAWGTATLWAGIDWTDKTYYTPFNRDVESQGAYALVNARAILKPANSPWSLSFWGKNLADRVVKSDTAISASFFGYPARGYLRDPRTYGVTFEYRYGGK